MSISFANAVGNLFNRVGKAALLLKQLRSYQSSQLTNMTDTSAGLVAQLNAESDIQALVGSSYIGQLGSPEAVGKLSQRVAEAAINRAVYRDSGGAGGPRINQTLTLNNTLASLQEIIRQMKVAGASIQKCTLAGTVSGDRTNSFTGTGLTLANISFNRPSDGLVQENSFAETILLTCTQDSYVGGATKYNEGYTATGQGSQSDFFTFNWPLGSGATIGFNAIDGNTNNGSGNVLSNAFTAFTSNFPTYWERVNGQAGTMFFQESTLIYDGTGALKVVGDGSSLGQILQTFNTSTTSGSGAGTLGILQPLTQYSVCLFARRDGVAPAAGKWNVDLVDSVGNIINDANGVANTLSIDLTALTTTYQGFLATFRTPSTLPTTYRLRMSMPSGNALTNNRAVYFAKGSLGQMTRFYIGGPSLAVHAGATAGVQGDFASIATTNDRGGFSNLGGFQVSFARWFPMRDNNLLLPSSNAPTISDSGLIA